MITVAAFGEESGSREWSRGNAFRLVPFTLYTFYKYTRKCFLQGKCFQVLLMYLTQQNKTEKRKLVGQSVANREQESLAYYQLDSH